MTSRLRVAAERALLVLAGGAIEVLSMPPGPAPGLVFLHDAPFLALLWHRGGRGWWAWAWLYGFARFLAGLRWLEEVHWTMALAAPFVLAFTQLAMAVAVRWLASRRLPFPLLVGACAVGQELLQTVVQGASGMPWPARSLAFAAWAPLVGAASMLGAYGLSFLAGATSAVASAVPGLLLRDGSAALRARALLGPALAVAAVAGIALFVGASHRDGVLGRMSGPAPAAARTSPLVVVQGNIPQSLKNERHRPGRAQDIFDKHLRITREALSDLADRRERPLAVLWPETMVPWPMLDPALARAFPEDWENQFVVLQNLQAQAVPDTTTRFLLGASRYFVGRTGRHEDLFDHDSTDGLLFADAARVPAQAPLPPEGAAWWTPPWEIGWHHKAVLVPWGEYTPGGSWLPALRRLRDQLSVIPEITPGPADQEPFLLAVAPPARPGGPNREVRAGTIICFEIAFPARCRAWRRAGATVLLNAGNYAWYGDTGMPAQVLALARLRAAELAATVVVAGNTGPSAIVDPSGAVREQVRAGGRTQFVEGWCAGPLWSDPEFWTPYARWGDVPWFALLGGLAVGAAWPRRHRSVTARGAPEGGAGRPPAEGSGADDSATRDGGGS